MRRTLLIAAGVGMLLGVLYLFGSFSYRIGTAASPGPGLYPLFVAGLMLVSSVALALEARSKALAGQKGWEWGAHMGRLVAIAAAIAVYIAILPYAGQVISGVIVTWVALQAVGGLGWKRNLGLCLAISGLSFVLFDVILGVPLPRGVFFD